MNLWKRERKKTFFIVSAITIIILGGIIITILSEQDITVFTTNDSCKTDSDCHIVTSYDYSNPIVETLIACKNKNIPLDNETESVREYNEYTKSTCICDNRKCNFKR